MSIARIPFQSNPVTDQSADVQAWLDQLPADVTEVHVTETLRASFRIRRPLTLKTLEGGVIIGGAPLRLMHYDHTDVNIVCDGPGITISAHVAAVGGGAVGFIRPKDCFVSRSRLEVASNVPGSANGMVMAFGGESCSVYHSVITGLPGDVQMGLIRLGGSNADQRLRAGDVVCNSLSLSGHTPIQAVCAGETKMNDIDCARQTNGSGIGVSPIDIGHRLIRANTIKNSPYHGIQADAADGMVVERVEVMANKIKNSGTFGISLARARGWAVKANEISGSGRRVRSGLRSISVTDGSSDIVLRHNTMTGNVGGVLVEAAYVGDVKNITLNCNKFSDNVAGLSTAGVVRRFVPFAARGLQGFKVIGLTSTGNDWNGMDDKLNSVWVDGQVVDLAMNDTMSGGIYKAITDIVGAGVK